MKSAIFLSAFAAVVLSACTTAQPGVTARTTRSDSGTAKGCPAVMATSLPYMNGHAILTIVPRESGVLLIRISAQNFADNEFYGFHLFAERRSREPARDGLIYFFDPSQPPLTLKQIATGNPSGEIPTADEWEATLELAVFADEPIQFIGSTKWSAELAEFNEDKGFTATHLSVGPKTHCTFEDLDLLYLTGDDEINAYRRAQRVR